MDFMLRRVELDQAEAARFRSRAVAREGAHTHEFVSTRYRHASQSVSSSASQHITEGSHQASVYIPTSDELDVFNIEGLSFAIQSQRNSIAELEARAYDMLEQAKVQERSQHKLKRFGVLGFILNGCTMALISATVLLAADRDMGAWVSLLLMWVYHFLIAMLLLGADCPGLQEKKERTADMLGFFTKEESSSSDSEDGEDDDLATEFPRPDS